MEAREAQELWSQLVFIRNASQWERKLTAASYLHHRDGYRGTQVESRTTYDSTTVGCMTTFVNGMLGNLMPREQRWFRFVPAGLVRSSDGGRVGLYTRYSQLDADTRLYRALSNLTDLVSVALQQSNFYDVMGMFLKDAAIMGTGFMQVVDEWGHRERYGHGTQFRLRFQVADPQDTVVGEDAHNGVDVAVRRLWMSSRSIEDRWGVDVTRDGRTRYDDGWEVLEVMRPEASSGREAGRPRRWSYSAVVSSGGLGKDGRELESGGFEGCPMFRYAMDRDSDRTPYGIGIAPKYLDDVVVLDEYGKAALKMGQRAGAPPLQVPYTMKDTFSGRPGAMVLAADEQRATRIFDGENPSYLLAMQQDARECIRRGFHADLFTAITQSNDSRRTAYEISETLKQANSLLKEHVYTLLDGFLSPLLMRVADIVVRQAGYISGGTDGIDRMLAEVLPSTSVIFDSVFMRMMDSVMSTDGIMQTFSVVPTLEQVYPGIRANFDENGMVRQLAVGLGLDSSLVRPLETVRKQQAELAQRLNRASDAQTAQSEAKASVDAAKAQAVMDGGVAGGQVQV